MVKEFCDPELDNSNICFLINGSVTVAVEGKISDNLYIIDQVRNITKEIMDKDELLTQDNPEVIKVKYFEDTDTDTDTEDDENGEVEGNNRGAAGQPPLPLMIGASVVALFSLVGLYLIQRYASMRMKSIPEPATILSPPLSFIAPDSDNLAKHSSCVDVHECKSAACQICYDSQNTPHFVHSYPYTKFDIGQYQQSSMDEDTMEQVVSSSDSDEFHN